MGIQFVKSFDSGGRAQFVSFFSVNGVPYTLTQDTSLKTSDTIILTQDIIQKVIQTYSVTSDNIYKSSSNVIYTQDNKVSVSYIYGLDQENFLNVSNDYILIQDSKCQISEGIVYSVNEDNLVYVSKVVLIRQDTVDKTSTIFKETQDTKCTCSVLINNIEDLRMKALTPLSFNVDTLNTTKTQVFVHNDIEIKLYRSFEELQEAFTHVSTPFAILQDGVAAMVNFDFEKLPVVGFTSTGSTTISMKSTSQVQKAFKSKGQLIFIKS